MMGVLGMQGGFAVAFFQEWMWGSEILLENVQLQFLLSKQVHNFFFRVAF